jgi:hypothetical protein
VAGEEALHPDVRRIGGGAGQDPRKSRKHGNGEV